MKNLLLIIVGFLTITSSALVFAGDKPEVFTIQDVEGDCKIKPPDATYQPAKINENYPTGSSGSTGPDGTLTIEFDQQHRFLLLPKAEVVIGLSTRDPKFQKEADLSLNLNKGGIRVIETKKDYELKVQTPTAICGAVGTDYMVEVNNNGKKNLFKCKEGTITAQSREDSSFKASKIKHGQSLDATVVPGKENSYASITTKGGEMPISFGSEDQLKVKEGSEIILAQEKTEKNTPAVLRIKNGNIDGKGEGRYVVEGDKMISYSKDDAPKLVDQYLEAAKKEGDLNFKYKETPSASNQEALDKAAEDASEKRRALLDYRDVIRRTVRENMNPRDAIPTQIPR